MTKTTEKMSYRDRLISYIKDAGQEIIDRAEQMVGSNTDLITNFNIHIRFDQELNGSVPTIEWSTEVATKITLNKIMNGDY